MGFLAEFPGFPVFPLSGEGRARGSGCQPFVAQLRRNFREKPLIMVRRAGKPASHRGENTMPVWQTMSVLALRPLVSGAAHALGMTVADQSTDGAVRFLAERLGDPSLRLTRALER